MVNGSYRRDLSLNLYKILAKDGDSQCLDISVKPAIDLLQGASQTTAPHAIGKDCPLNTRELEKIALKLHDLVDELKPLQDDPLTTDENIAALESKDPQQYTGQSSFLDVSGHFLIVLVEYQQTVYVEGLQLDGLFVYLKSFLQAFHKSVALPHQIAELLIGLQHHGNHLQNCLYYFQFRRRQDHGQKEKDLSPLILQQRMKIIFLLGKLLEGLANDGRIALEHTHH